jgi:hypothetical protein
MPDGDSKNPSSSVPSRPRQNAPVWQTDRDAPNCNKCKTAFSLFFRRHHCRYCGKVRRPPRRHIIFFNVLSVNLSVFSLPCTSLMRDHLMRQLSVLNTSVPILLFLQAEKFLLKLLQEKSLFASDFFPAAQRFSVRNVVRRHVLSPSSISRSRCASVTNASSVSFEMSYFVSKML